MDYRRAPLGHDTHSGTDFALTARARMARDVDVPPATPGTVRGARDGIRDVVFTTDQTDAPGGRDCGNGVAIDHGGGWTTRYCHLEKGSIRIKTGDRLRMATVLGQVGRSGRSQFPQLHMTLRKDGQAVGPFDPEGRITCDTPGTDILWLSPPPGRPGGLLDVGFADAVPGFDAIRAGEAAARTRPVSAPAMVLFGPALMGLRVDGPDGSILDRTMTFDKDQSRFFRAAGKKRRGVWARGTDTGSVDPIRNGAVIQSKQGAVAIEQGTAVRLPISL